MDKIFKEYGSVIIAVIAILALVALVVYFAGTPESPMGKMFSDLINNMMRRMEHVVPGSLGGGTGTALFH